MNRRKFLKGMGLCLGLAYASPVSLIPDPQRTVVYLGEPITFESIVVKNTADHVQDALSYTLGRGTVYFKKKGADWSELGNIEFKTEQIKGELNATGHDFKITG